MGPVMLLATLVAAAGSLAVTEACVCMPVEDPEQEYCSTDVVFRGTVLAEDQVTTDEDNPFSWFRLYSVRVDQAIKMPDSFKDKTTLNVMTPLEGSMCGVSLLRMTAYTIFARVIRGGSLETDSCFYQAALLQVTANPPDCTSVSDNHHHNQYGPDVF